MGDEWKIVQGLKRQAQNNSFGRKAYKDFGERIERKERKMTKKQEARYRRDIAMRELKSSKFFERDDENEKLRINQLKTYIKEHKEDEEDIKMKIGEMNITIDKNQPTKINFVSYGDINGRKDTVLKYPYRITIYGDEIYSEVDMIQQCALASYKESREDTTKLTVSRTVTVVNSDEINEYIDLKGQNSEEVIEDLVKQNSEYLKGEEGSIYRSEINPDDEIKKMSELGIYYKKIDTKTKIVEFPIGFGIESIEFIEAISKGEDINVEENNNNPKKYEEGIKISKEIEEHCKYIYSILIEAEKGILEQAKTNESKTPNQDIIQNNTAEPQESLTMKDDEDIENLSEEELDVLIEKMENLQREKQSKIERLQKIKKAQDLIALSKDQDKIIADLESQIGIEGVDLGEK